VNGLIYATRKQITIGLVVENDWVTKGPPYAYTLGVIDRHGQEAWRKLRSMGWTLEWRPT
jgi:hypothetical protein